MTSKMKHIVRALAVGLIAIVVAGCEVEAPLDPGQLRPDIKPGFDFTLSPKKTIPIKRKKPTINNPSPRPLSAGYVTEAEDYDNYDNYE